MDGPDDTNSSVHEPHFEERVSREVLFIIAYLLPLDIELSNLPKDFESQYLASLHLLDTSVVEISVVRS